MASRLPPVARFVFMILEPISLVAGCVVPFWNTQHFVALQLPSNEKGIAAPEMTQTERMLALQLGNMFGLVSLIGLAILYGASEMGVVRKYLAACAIGDVGHLWAVYTGMGHKKFFDMQTWNDYAWGSIGFTSFLLACRTLYLTGNLGQDSMEGGTRPLGGKQKRRLS